MASLYVNTTTGKVARMLEPAELEQSRGKKAALDARRTLARMDDSKKWKRVSESEATEAEARYEEKRASLRKPRSAAPTPVYVVNAEPKSEPEVTDGVRSAGGGWYEVVKGGEVVDKVRGKEAAEEVYETD